MVTTRHAGARNVLRTHEGQSADPEFHGIRLGFADHQLDREFRRANDEAAVSQVVIAGILGVVINGIFGLIDVLILPGDLDDLTGVFVIRFGVIVPLIALGTVLLLTSRWMQQHVQLGYCVILVAVAVSFDAMALLSTVEVPLEYPRTGSLLILALLFVFHVRFLWAVGSALVVIAAFEASMIWIGTPWVEVVYHTAFVLSFFAIGAAASYTLERLRRTAFLRERALEQERARSDELLHNILPVEIATRLRNEPSAIAEAADDVSVLFADIVGFTPFAETLPPDELVRLLDGLFTLFDDLCGEHGVEKIKTIGDAYMAVAGLPRPDPDHAGSIAELALDMQAAAGLFAEHWPGPLDLRIGISSGPVVAGVIGHRKFAYDLWGDTVNTASRLESHGHPGRILVDNATRRLLNRRYVFGEPEVRDVKGKGEMSTHVLRGRVGVVTSDDDRVGVS